MVEIEEFILFLSIPSVQMSKCRNKYIYSDRLFKIYMNSGKYEVAFLKECVNAKHLEWR